MGRNQVLQMFAAALAVLASGRRMGLRIPEDVAVVGGGVRSRS
jgi:DNA-binding LacI/PurR family transcriptional regulator